MSLIETDPQERQAEIDRLIFDATVRGVVPLPTLTDDQLCVLSEGRWPLTDVPVWTDWAALDPGVRFARGERALRELAAAGHVLGWQHDAHGWTVSAAPALALLTAARARPSYAAFGAGPGAGHVGPALAPAMPRAGWPGAAGSRRDPGRAIEPRLGQDPADGVGLRAHDRHAAPGDRGGPAVPAGRLLDGGALNRIILNVTALMEVKSSMGVIVAAPTAGAGAALNEHLRKSLDHWIRRLESVSLVREPAMPGFLASADAD